MNLNYIYTQKTEQKLSTRNLPSLIVRLLDKWSILSQFDAMANHSDNPGWNKFFFGDFFVCLKFYAFLKCITVELLIHTLNFKILHMSMFRNRNNFCLTLSLRIGGTNYWNFVSFVSFIEDYVKQKGFHVEKNCI